jgi:signal transduction histidine kinase
VQDAIAGLRHLADAKGLSISIRSDPDVPDVALDAESMADAVRNLVENAIKYSPVGSRVDVTLTRQERALVLAVSDEGVGVNPHETERIFEPFYRSRRGDLANVHGTGLGLALVKATAEAHGGSVTVVPNHPRGSRFTMRLPSHLREGAHAAGDHHAGDRQQDVDRSVLDSIRR